MSSFVIQPDRGNYYAAVKCASRLVCGKSYWSAELTLVYPRGLATR